MLRDALNFPPSGEHGSRAVVIGGSLLGLLGIVGGVSSFLTEAQLDQVEPVPEPITLGLSLLMLLVLGISSFCVFLIHRGYYVAVLRAVASPTDNTAPAFRPRVVVDGIKAVGIFLCYLLPSIVLGVVGLVLRQPAGPTWLGELPNVVGALAFLFALFGLLIAAYLLPAATTLFATRRSFLAAFDRSTLRACVVTEDYAVGWVLATVVRIVLLPVTIALQVVLIGFFLQFYVQVSAQHIYAVSVANALGIGTDEH